MPGDPYEALTVETLPARLARVADVADRVGGGPSHWSVREVGDGNLNLVFIVSGPRGERGSSSRPFPTFASSARAGRFRSTAPTSSTTRSSGRRRGDPGSVPEVFHFDETQALIAMEYLEPHVILRYKMVAGERVEGLGAFLGTHCARMAFRGSELHLPSAEKKAEVALFAGNVEIPAITEALVFTDPYYGAEMNRHTDGLGPVVAQLREDVALKTEVQKLFVKFATNTETMLHGDLHTGSVMSTATGSRIIDPEFAQYGPMGFDIGMLTANYLMAYFSQPAHREPGELHDYQEWLLRVMADHVHRLRRRVPAALGERADRHAVSRVPLRGPGPGLGARPRRGARGHLAGRSRLLRHRDAPAHPRSRPQRGLRDH